MHGPTELQTTLAPRNSSVKLVHRVSDLNDLVVGGRNARDVVRAHPSADSCRDRQQRTGHRTRAGTRRPGGPRNRLRRKRRRVCQPCSLSFRRAPGIILFPAFGPSRTHARTARQRLFPGIQTEPRRRARCRIARPRYTPLILSPLSPPGSRCRRRIDGWDQAASRTAAPLGSQARRPGYPEPREQRQRPTGTGGHSAGRRRQGRAPQRRLVQPRLHEPGDLTEDRATCVVIACTVDCGSTCRYRR